MVDVFIMVSWWQVLCIRGLVALTLMFLLYFCLNWGRIIFAMLLVPGSLSILALIKNDIIFINFCGWHIFLLGRRIIIARDFFLFSYSLWQVINM